MDAEFLSDYVHRYLDILNENIVFRITSETVVTPNRQIR
jgi:hypothetical protein